MDSYKTYSDEQLVKLLKNSDAQAFRVIYDRYWKLLFSVAFSKLDVFDDAEEIVQEIFTDIWARRDSLSINRSLKYYLAACVKYQVMTILTKRKLQSAKTDALPLNLTTSDTADKYIHFHQLIKELELIVTSLPERCQLIYRLSREEEYSHKEIAEKLNISEKTVETQITRALKRIKGGLGDTSLLLFLHIF